MRIDDAMTLAEDLLFGVFDGTAKGGIGENNVAGKISNRTDEAFSKFLSQETYFFGKNR